MASIVFADSTLRYDGRDLERRPLGGTETSVIRCARELARRGHQVTCFTNCDGAGRGQRRRLASAVERTAATRATSTSPATSSICCRSCRGRGGACCGCCGRPISCGTTRKSGGCGSTGRSPCWSATIRRRPGHGCCRGPIRRSCCRSVCRRMCGAIRRCDARRRRHAIFASNPEPQSAPPGGDLGVVDPAARSRCHSRCVWRASARRPAKMPGPSWEGDLLPPGMPAQVKASVRVHPSASRQDLIAAMRALAGDALSRPQVGSRFASRRRRRRRSACPRCSRR